MKKWMFASLVMLAAACGGSDHSPTSVTPPAPPPPPPPPTTATTVAIAITDSLYRADSVVIRTGDQVVWTNEGTTNHNVTSNDDLFQSATLAPPSPSAGLSGGFFAVTFTRAGTYPYHCALHPSMKGVITVQ